MRGGGLLRQSQYNLCLSIQAKLEQKSDARVGLTFEIMDQLYDPHKIAETVFIKCQKEHKNVTFKIRLLLFTVAARLMGKYNVSLPGFFSFFTKYVRPSQDQVTRILAVLAQAVHDSVNEDELQQCTKLIADQFVVEASPPQVITIGINTVSLPYTHMHSNIVGLLICLIANPCFLIFWSGRCHFRSARCAIGMFRV